jgi:hypothetical protein
MDEKWFESTKVRTQNKCIPAMGVGLLFLSIQHKKHILKVMCITTTAFVPLGNDITKGGYRHKVTLVRCGKMVITIKALYKCQ